MKNSKTKLYEKLVREFSVTMECTQEAGGALPVALW